MAHKANQGKVYGPVSDLYQRKHHTEEYPQCEKILRCGTYDEALEVYRELLSEAAGDAVIHAALNGTLREAAARIDARDMLSRRLTADKPAPDPARDHRESRERMALTDMINSIDENSEGTKSEV